MGPENSGKSTLCEYLFNLSKVSSKGFCILDVDIGKNRKISGTVSLSIFKNGKEESISLWVGEFTPWNNMKGYFEAIRYLFEVYQDKYFTCGLVVNTMGYLSGIG